MRVRELLLPWNNNKHCIFICVCVCVCARARARMGACMRVCAWMTGRLGLCMRARARVALFIQHATRMRHIVTSFMAPLALRHIFLHYLINDTIFEKKRLNVKCVFSLQLLSETFLILRRI